MFGRKKRDLTERLLTLQKKEEDEQVRQQIREIELEMDKILRAEETMWFQRSRALWLRDGDRNSTFFHQKAFHRKKKNTINSIHNEEGTEQTTFEDISKVIREYYTNMFSSDGVGDMANTLDAVECRVTTQMNEMLAQPFSADEVL